MIVYTDHEYAERDGWPVCRRCGMVRNASKPTECRRRIPAIVARDGADARDPFEQASAPGSRAGRRWLQECSR
jgi:hypothetical protein